MNPIKRIRTAANVSLIGSALAVAVVIALHFLWHYHFVLSPRLRIIVMACCCVLAVGAIMLVLNRLRRATPTLRQLDDVDEKLCRYASLVSQVFYPAFVITLLECVCIVLLGENTLLMIVLLLVMLQVLSYPNMYKIKVDLGLDDVEMTRIFGDAYIADPESETTLADLVDEAERGVEAAERGEETEPHEKEQ